MIIKCKKELWKLTTINTKNITEYTKNNKRNINYKHWNTFEILVKFITILLQKSGRAGIWTRDTVQHDIHDFQSCSFSHSDTLPNIDNGNINRPLLCSQIPPNINNIINKSTKYFSIFYFTFLSLHLTVFESILIKLMEK